MSHGHDPVTERPTLATARWLSRGVFGAVPRVVWLILAVLAIPLVVALAADRGMLELVALGVAGVAGVAVTIARPRIILLLYIALIPLEAVLVVGQTATLTRGIGAMFFVGYVLRRFGHMHVRAVPASGWAFVAWAVASVVWAMSTDAAIDQVMTLVQLFAMTVVIADFVAEEPRLARHILVTFAAAASATAAIAVGGALTSGVVGDERLGAFEAQDVAQFAALLVPAFLFALGEALDRRHLVLASGTLALVSSAVILSGTRSAWIAFAVGGAVLVVPRIGRRGVGPLLAVAISVLALFTVDDLRLMVVDRLSTALSSGGAGRVDIWTVGLNIFREHALLGVGYGNFPVAFTPEIIRDTDVPGLDINVLDPGAGPHSIVIATLAELGIVGVTMLAAFVWTILRSRGTTAAWPVVYAATAALLTQALFLDVTNRKHFWLVIALVFGLAWRAAMDRRVATQQQTVRHEHVAEQIRRTWEGRPG